MFVDILTILSFVFVYVLAIVKKIAISRALLNSAVSFFAASALIQILEFRHIEPTSLGIQIAVISANLTGAVVLVAFSQSGESNNRNYFGLIVPLIFSATGIILGRVLASNQPSASITTLSFLTGAEDNAKWLNISSQISSGSKIAIGNLGGVLTCFLVSIAAIVRTFHRIVFPQGTDIQIIIDTVSLAEILVIPLSTLSLITMWTNKSTNRNLATRIFEFVPIAFLFQMFIASTKGVGHLSLAIAIIFLTYGIAGVMQTDNSFVTTVSYYFVIELALSEWLPTQIALPFFVLFAILECNLSWSKKVSGLRRAGASIILIIPTLLSIESFRFVSKTSGYLSSLFAATGGTLQATPTAQYVALISLAIFLLKKGGMPQMIREAWPIAFLIIFYAAIQTNDVFRTGKLNYGSQKFGFLLFLVLLFTTVQFSLEYVICHYKTNSNWNLSGIFLALLLAFSFNSDGLLTSFWTPYRSQQWPSGFQVSDKSWQRFGSGYSVDNSTSSDIPISCVVVSPGKSPETNPDTYLCTRFLVAVAGLELEGGRLVEWQLGQDWATAHARLGDLNEIVMQRKILAIDKDSSEVSLVSIRNFLDEHEP